MDPKTHRIFNLKDEVTEIHPLLNVLFKRLSDIKNVQYTHGKDEMGADFILSRFNRTLSEIDYIGVIVKAGQISQNHSDVDRQIEECAIERHIEGGKKKIYLSEIWVVANRNITTGAQTKIHHNYKNRNIKFIDGEKLTGLIDKYYNEYWEDVSIHIGEYLRKVYRIAERLSSNSAVLNVANQDIYIEQKIKRFNSKIKYDAGRKRKEEITTINNALNKEDYILVQGAFGTGKTKLICNLVMDYAENTKFNETKVVPFLTTASDFIEKHNTDIDRIIEKILNETKISEENSFLICIDGLDELNLSEDRRISFIENLYDSSKVRNNLKIILTTRKFDDPSFIAQIDNYFARYEICQLSVTQVINFIDKICENANISNKLTKDLNKSQLFKVLPKTPISAILLARLLSEDLQEIPSTMTELYTKYMELALGRWDISKGLQSQSEYDVIFNTSINVAYFMLNNSLDQIAISEVQRLFNEYVDSRNLIKINRDESFAKLINNKEIFNINKQNGTFRFQHRTFSEYLYAAGLNRDHDATISSDIFDLYWFTSYFFYVGLQRDCPSILSAIDNIQFQSDKEEFLKLIQHGSLLLAAYLTPYENIKDSLAMNFKQSARLYNSLVNNLIDSPITSLSAVALLSIITHCLCETFGYEYFSEAINERALDISSDPNLDEIGMIELFLVNSVKLEINSNDAYDTMIESYGKNIPLILQCEMIEHSHQKKRESTVVKRLFKNIRKRARKNKNIYDCILSFYEEPISELMMETDTTPIEVK